MADTKILDQECCRNVNVYSQLIFLTLQSVQYCFRRVEEPKTIVYQPALPEVDSSVTEKLGQSDERFDHRQRIVIYSLDS